MKYRFMVLIVLAATACSRPYVKPEASVENADSYAATGWAAATLPQIRDALRNGDIAAEALVGIYLERIRAVDRAGPTLQSVLALNPDALDEARALDARRAAGGVLGPLHGVPVLVKDNIETRDAMATTAGALALKDNVTGRDSPLVAGLRAAGAVMLGKANLSQWANFRSNDSLSGWSALGGQVRNPHVLDRNPCGSSSGSGAAVAASLAAGAVGTETNGSIICPSAINGIVGFKPTLGLVSQQYIIPISFSQDTAGPMTKTVLGAAMMLTAMADGPRATDYVSALDEDALRGARVGVLRFAQGSSNDIKARFDAALAAMEAAGAVLVEIEEFPARDADFSEQSRAVLDYEFKASITEYLANTPVAGQPRSLAELIAFNEDHAAVEMALFDQSIFVQAQARGGLDDPEYLQARDAVQRLAGAEGIDKLLAEYDADILVSPSGPIAPRIDPVNGDTWPARAGAGWMAAIAGYPHASVPAGTVHGLPFGVSFIGAADADAEVLSFAYAYEQRTNWRAAPRYLNNTQERPELAAAMKPARRN